MNTFKCTSCGAVTSSKCPECGAKKPFAGIVLDSKEGLSMSQEYNFRKLGGEIKTGKLWGFLTVCGFGIISLVAVAIIYQLTRPQTEIERQQAEVKQMQSTARAVCRDGIKSKLFAPETAKFSWRENERVAAIQYNDTVIVDYKITAQNKFGAESTSWWQCHTDGGKLLNLARR